MANKWKLKPVVIEAIQWTGKNAEELREFGFEGYLACLEKGCYILKNQLGNVSICPETIFLATYERELVWDENI